MVMVPFPARIAGGLLTRRKSRAGRWWYLWAGVCRSRVTQPEAYGVFGLPLLLPLRRSFISRFSSVSLRYGKRPLHWMMGGDACRWTWPKQQGISLFIFLGREPPPVASFFRWIEYPCLYRGTPTNSSAITWRSRASSWDCRRRNLTPNSLPLAHRTVASSTLIGTASRDP